MQRGRAGPDCAVLLTVISLVGREQREHVLLVQVVVDLLALGALDLGIATDEDGVWPGEENAGTAPSLSLWRLRLQEKDGSSMGGV